MCPSSPSRPLHLIYLLSLLGLKYEEDTIRDYHQRIMEAIKSTSVAVYPFQKMKCHRRATCIFPLALNCNLTFNSITDFCIVLWVQSTLEKGWVLCVICLGV
ncbi:hypothetical protein CFOL_v3_24312 [Cephalotus follicularis]|uniref:UBN2_2 domain-containing protein n=1 Tax=Cephalotus follicularis TaxID=3775 RepID=A0A1Q3CL73_CEPFO|nr:hypothetical protein CFOL_v3_24312 [Cephalotus follicularis]